jgi:hypothetical protein
MQVQSQITRTLKRWFRYLSERIMKPMRALCSLCVIGVIAVAAGSTSAQPPVAPDPRPAVISPSDLDKAIGGPTLVTLQFKDAPPEKVFGSLAEQAGVYFNAYTSSTDGLKKLVPPMTVAVERQPFLSTLQTLAARYGLRFALKTSFIAESATGLTLALERSEDPQMQMSGPVLARGPFVVIATSIQRARTVALTADPAKAKPAPAARGDLYVDFVVLADPKLRERLIGAPVFWDAFPVNDREANRWTFRSVDSGSEQGVWGERFRNMGRPPLEWRYTAHRTLPTNGDVRFPPLKATATQMLVTTKSVTWEVQDILSAKNTAKEVSLTEGSRRYIVHEVKKAPDKYFPRRGFMYEVRLSLSGVGITKGRWSGWPALTSKNVVDTLRLVDAEGRDFAPYRYELKDETFTCAFSSGAARGVGKVALGQPATLLWQLPTEIRTIVIPMEFSDLPMP